MVLQRLSIPDAYFWSQWQSENALPANSFLFVRDGGNIAIDPLALDETGHERLKELGGIAKILVTNADHERDAHALAARYSAQVISRPEHREVMAPGMFALRLLGQKSEHEFAVTIPEHQTVIVGDSILGTPAGELSMLADEKYADVVKAALGLRRILRQNPKTLLVGHGHSLFVGAYDALYRLLYARAGPEVHRINVDELDLRDERDEHSSQPSKFNCIDAEVGWEIGARKLGYRVSTLLPGNLFCPMHSHAREEEMFFVLDGEPSVRMTSGTIRCRKGDFVALPVGETGAHQLLNESDAPATILLLARTEETDACYYPDSNKLLVDTEVPFVRGQRSMLIGVGPELDYFHGE